MKMIQLIYFITAVESGSMKKAAEKLNVTHSALSISLSALEKEFNKKLLIRSHTGCILTSDGIPVYNLAKKIQQQFEQLENIKIYSKKLYSISITSLSPSLSSAIYHINYDFMAQYPSAQIRLTEHFNLPLETALNNSQQADFTFFLSYTKKHADSTTYQLFSSPYIFCLSKKHPLAVFKRLNLEDIHEYPLFIFIEQNIENPNISIAHSYECLNSFATIKNLLTNDFNIALIPAIFLNSKFFMFNQNLCAIPVIDFKLKINGYVSYKLEQLQTEMQQNYLKFLEKYSFA